MNNKNWKYSVSIVGLGNYIMGDDGAGIYLIKKLRKEKLSVDINLIDAGTAPLNYLDEISKSKKIIAVDTITGGEKPGTVYKLNMNDLKNTTAHDLHGCSLFDVIKIAQSITGLPTNIVIFGIEPENINLGTTLSQRVKKAILKVENIIKTF